VYIQIYLKLNLLRVKPFLSIALGHGLDDRGFESLQGLGIFLFTTSSRPAKEPTQPPIQRVPGVSSLGVKPPKREADYSPPHSAEVNVWNCTWCSVEVI